jgi:hypothetical protein
MNQFILWHKWDIILTAFSPPVQHLEGVVEEGEIVSPSPVTPGFLKNKTRLIICVPRKSTHMPE